MWPRTPAKMNKIEPVVFELCRVATRGIKWSPQKCGLSRFQTKFLTWPQFNFPTRSGRWWSRNQPTSTRCGCQAGGSIPAIQGGFAGPIFPASPQTSLVLVGAAAARREPLARAYRRGVSGGESRFCGELGRTARAFDIPTAPLPFHPEACNFLCN